MDEKISEVKNKWLSASSWLFFLLSLIVSFSVPEVSQKVSNFGIIKIFKDGLTFDYRMTAMVFGSLVVVFAIMYGIDFLRKKYLNYSPPPNKTEEELKKGLVSQWLMMETSRIYAVILGVIIKIFSIFGIDISK